MNGHGGSPTLDEVPVCQECSAALKPKAKFCDECGESTEPKAEEPPASDIIKCPECGNEVGDAKFCGECGHKMTEEPAKKETVKKAEKKAEEPAEKSIKIPEKKEDAPKEKTVKKPEKEEEEGEEEEQPEEETVDLSGIDPEKEWECFGMIEPEHTECKTCGYRERCAAKAGVEI